MRRRWLAAALLLVVIGIAVWVAGARGCAPRRPSAARPSTAVRAEAGDAVVRLHTIPLYRSLLTAEALRQSTIESDGTLHIEVDLRELLRPRLRGLGLEEVSDILPASARGTIAISRSAGTASAAEIHESWIFPGPTPLLDLLDRSPSGEVVTAADDAIPGAPSARVRVRLAPSQLADPSFGGAALASWRNRADLVERVLGRPLRAEIAQDLAGPAAIGLYESADATEAEMILAVELKSSDRIRGLLETLFALAALSEHARVGRYRGVPTGSFIPASGGPGLALAVDGPLLLAATSLSRLEAAIDARREGRHHAVPAAPGSGLAASWSAASSSSFVAHGWARLARSAEDPAAVRAVAMATLRPEGEIGWRLEGHGPSAAITADPIVPFLRSVFRKRQREAD